jgi:hypothetical protein
MAKSRSNLVFVKGDVEDLVPNTANNLSEHSKVIQALANLFSPTIGMEMPFKNDMLVFDVGRSRGGWLLSAATAVEKMGMKQYEIMFTFPYSEREAADEVLFIGYI